MQAVPITAKPYVVLKAVSVRVVELYRLGDLRDWGSALYCLLKDASEQ